MQYQRNANFQQMPLNMVGSSIFGRYSKISVEKTTNMFISDNALVPYSGWLTAIQAAGFALGAKEGRGLYSSPKLGRMIAVIDSTVYSLTISYSTLTNSFTYSVMPVGHLATSHGPVSIAENDIPQIEISDYTSLYCYTPKTGSFVVVPTSGFTPGYVTFHDTYFIVNGVGTNVWYLSVSNDGTSFPQDSLTTGFLQTKPDNVVAVVRFPSKGNMILVMGQTVCEAWFDSGYQLFPYQRSTQMSIDYGCLNPATIAASDEIIVWLASSEKSGPIIMYSNGDLPQKITTDGIDYLFSQLTAPEDSQAFLYRQDGHLFYHINFYTDNMSLFYDFNTNKFYNACDSNYNYFIAADVAFFDNQYYFVSKNTGNLYALDTIFTTYDELVIPRQRICSHIRLPSQDYFIINDVGYTIEQGDTDYYEQDLGTLFLTTESGVFLTTESGDFLIAEQDANNLFPVLPNALPRVDLSISYDGGESYSADMPYVLNAIGQRRNRLMWWQLGIANDATARFNFWSIGRIVAFDGVMNIRT